jgi:hypothetical protein
VSFVAGAPATTSAPEVGRLDEEIEERRERDGGCFVSVHGISTNGIN